jgi:predicted  nucleic acid-binding Zn-ribbon protein
MKKNLFFVLLLLAFVMVLAVGCGVKDGDKDTHYKPAEFKHDVAISDANRTVTDIEKEIIAFGAETSVDILIETYNDGIQKLNTQIATLDETRAKLKDDSDLSASEVKRWETEYANTITGVKNSIQEIEKKKQKIYE